MNHTILAMIRKSLEDAGNVEGFVFGAYTKGGELRLCANDDPEMNLAICSEMMSLMVGRMLGHGDDSERPDGPVH